MIDWLLIALAGVFVVLFAVAAFGIAMTIAMFVSSPGRIEHGEAQRDDQVGVADLPRASAYGHPDRVGTALPDTSPMPQGSSEAPRKAQDGPRSTRRTGRPCTPCKRFRSILRL